MKKFNSIPGKTSAVWKHLPLLRPPPLCPVGTCSGHRDTPVLWVLQGALWHTRSARFMWTHLLSLGFGEPPPAGDFRWALSGVPAHTMILRKIDRLRLIYYLPLMFWSLLAAVLGFVRSYVPAGKGFTEKRTPHLSDDCCCSAAAW